MPAAKGPGVSDLQAKIDGTAVKGGSKTAAPKAGAKSVADIQKSIDTALGKLGSTPAAGQAADVGKHHESWWQKALNTVTIPQKVIVSAANELGQGINAAFTPGHDPNDPRYKGSVGDIWKNVFNYEGKGRGIGVGDVIEQSHPNLNPWVKRGLGFTGDVLTDPITYLGAEDQLAKLGRIGTATKIAEAGKAAEVAGDTARATRLFEDAARVGEKGIAHASDEGLASFGARGGVMFNVPGTGRIARGVRRLIPGLEAGELKQLQIISRESGTGKGLSAIAKGFDNVFSKAKGLDVVSHVLEKFGGEEGRAALKRDIASGDPTKVYAATQGLHAANLKVVAEQRFAATLEHEMKDIFRVAKKARISGEDLQHAAQGSSEAMARVAASSPEVASRIRPFFDDALARLNEVGGREILKPVENYGPRQLTDQAAELMGIGRHGDFARTSGIASFEKKRKLIEGETFLGRKLVSAAEHPEGLTVEQQVTDALRKAVSEGKVEAAQKALVDAGINGDVHVFNPDAYEAWPRYVRSMSKRAGFAKQEAYLREAGVWADRGHFVNILEDSQAKLVAANAAAATAGGDAAVKAAAVEEARAAVVHAHEVLVGMHEAAAAHVEGAARAVQTTVANLQLPVKEAEALRSYADEFFGAPIESLQHEAQQVTQDISTHTDTLASSYANLDQAAEAYRSAVAKQDFLNGEIRRIQGGVEQAAQAGHDVSVAESKLSKLGEARAEASQAVHATSSNLADAQGIAQANASRLSELQAQAIGTMDAIDFKEQFLRTEAQAHYDAAAGFEAQAKAAAAADVNAAVADGNNAMTLVLAANYTAQGKVAEAEAMLADAKRLSRMAGTRAKKIENAARELDAKIAKLVKEIDKDPNAAMRFVETYRGAMQPIGKNGVADPVIIESMAASAKAVMPKDVGAILKQYDKLQNVWKAYALATPGWHFRNVFGDVWQNYLGGVEMGGMSTYMRLKWHYTHGTLDKLSEKEATAIKTWVEQGPNWGRGVMSEVEHRPFAGANVNPLSRDFAPLRANQYAGEHVEEVLRGAHGVDRLMKGDTIEEAIGQVYRFHGDYTDLSQFERNVVKRIVPFYTWSRKVLPVQIEQIIRQPQKFARFGQLKNEVEAESTPQDFVPGYFLSQLSIRTPFQHGGGNVYVDPHLPFQDVTKFNSVENVLSNVTPILKTPAELVAGKRFFTGQPFNGKFQAIPGAWQKIPGFVQVASKLGFAKKGADGTWMMTDRNLYKVENSLPVFGQTRRLLPSESKYQDRALTSYLSFFLGAGVRANTSSDQSSEALGQMFKLQQISAEQKSLGYLPSKSKTG